MGRYLWPYRWQIGLLPFFVASVWLALSLEVAGNKAEFVIISVAYAAADILMVNYFVAENRRARALSQAGAMTIFASVFLFTYLAYGEAQYMLAQPLFWVAGWKSIAEVTAPQWYPYFLGKKALVGYWFAAALVAFWEYLSGGSVHSLVHLVQFFGVSLLGLSLALDKRALDAFWRHAGALGLIIFTLMCLVDVLTKYTTQREIIATPLVAFFAAFPVAIMAVESRDKMAGNSLELPAITTSSPLVLY